jgi:hypothetical protein
VNTKKKKKKEKNHISFSTERRIVNSSSFCGTGYQTQGLGHVLAWPVVYN